MFIVFFDRIQPVKKIHGVLFGLINFHVLFNVRLRDSS